MQNQSVAFYPTPIRRQLYLGPMAEYAILHFQILHGDDRLANFVQWGSMAGSVTGVSLLAKQLGARIRGQVMASAVCASIPMGILQSTSTQTDYVAAFWLVCAVHLALQMRHGAGRAQTLGTGAALGLAVLTKGTAYIYAFPFFGWAAICILRSRDRRRILSLAVALALAFVINAPQFARNFAHYGSPLGPTGEGPGYTFANDVFTAAGTTSNIVRNIGLHLGTPFEEANRFFEDAIVTLHERLGASTRDPRTSWAGMEFHVPTPPSRFDLANTPWAPLATFNCHEDVSGNFLHLLLILASLFVLIFARKSGTLLLYAASLIAAFTLFCAYLKWQPWNSRLHLSLFVLWAPVVGIALSRLRPAFLGNAITLIVLLMAFPWMAVNQTRPMAGHRSVFTHPRDDQYFFQRTELAAPYKEAAERLAASGCGRIGLWMTGNDWEYPLWVQMRERNPGRFRMENVNVPGQPVREKLDDPESAAWIPCAIFSTDPAAPGTLTVDAATFRRTWSPGPVSLFAIEP
jgi:hypothetical protein